MPPGPAGLKRTAGTWLFNGWPVVEEFAPGTQSDPPRSGDAQGPAGGPGPASFIFGLTRAEKRKFPVTFKLPAPGGEPLRFRTLALPPATDMVAPGYDLTSLQSRIRTQLSLAGTPYVGFSLPSRGPKDTALGATEMAALMPRLRSALQSVVPGAALLYEVPVRDAELAARDVLAAGALADGILLDYTPGEASLWPLKVARRLVEEADGFDLPLLVRFAPRAGDAEGNGRSVAALLMHGATTVVLPRGSSVPLGWLRETGPLLEGAVTLEDAGLLQNEDGGMVAWDAALRAGGRLPLLGRLPRDAKAPAESILIRLGDATSSAQLEDIKRTLGRGATLYLEGVPNLTRPELLAAMQDITGTLITLLDKPVRNSLKLEDAWTFGSARNTELPVLQRVKVEARPSLAAQTRVQPGLDKMVTPRMVARLATDPGGLLAYAVGKGRVFWNPHVLERTDSPGAAQFYAAIAGAMQSSLLKWSAKDERAMPMPLEVALRLSAGKTPLVAVFNRAAVPVRASLVMRGAPALIHDVLARQDLQFSQRGYEASLTLSVPANGWALLALPSNKKAWDKELPARK